jgi:Tfp pilus assembly protein PilN
MIKINLLESITDRPTGAAMVEARVASPLVQTMLLAITVFGLLVIGISYDYVSSKSDHSTAQQELEKQRRINQQMLAVNKEQADLEKKAQDVQGRIDAIKRLRESQQGPSAVLREIKTRFDNVPGLYLKSLEQKDGELTIKGLSPSESAVTRFGQSLEFSSGLFTNLNIETQRELVQIQASERTATAPSDSMIQLQQPEVVGFTVKCGYGAKSQSQKVANPAANQVALKK